MPDSSRERQQHPRGVPPRRRSRRARILYAPDYVINAGGLINVADELEGYNECRATKRVMRIEDSVRRIIAISKRDGVPTNEAADTLALERISAISSMERLHTGHPYGQLRRRRETI